MGQGIDLTVNRLPVKTWNRLNMNEAGLKQIEAGEAPSVITEGFAEPETWNSAFPAIATGMGRDMDRLAEEAGTPAIRIISGPSGKEGRASCILPAATGPGVFSP